MNAIKASPSIPLSCFSFLILQETASTNVAKKNYEVFLYFDDTSMNEI